MSLTGSLSDLQISIPFFPLSFFFHVMPSVLRAEPWFQHFEAAVCERESLCASGLNRLDANHLHCYLHGDEGYRMHHYDGFQKGRQIRS